MRSQVQGVEGRCKVMDMIFTFFAELNLDIKVEEQRINQRFIDKFLRYSELKKFQFNGKSTGKR